MLVLVSSAAGETIGVQCRGRRGLERAAKPESIQIRRKTFTLFHPSKLKDSNPFPNARDRGEDVRKAGEAPLEM
jgi:hypothetical protein